MSLENTPAPPLLKLKEVSSSYQGQNPSINLAQCDDNGHEEQTQMKKLALSYYKTSYNPNLQLKGQSQSNVKWNFKFPPKIKSQD